jgi:hypothetical protein
MAHRRGCIETLGLVRRLEIVWPVSCLGGDQARKLRVGCAWLAGYVVGILVSIAYGATDQFGPYKVGFPCRTATH